MVGFWAGVGSCAAIVTAFFAFQQWRRSRVVVEARIKQHEIIFPSDLYGAMASLREAKYWAKTQTELTAITDSLEKLVETLNRYGILYSAGGLHCAEIELRNLGTEEVRNVGLQGDKICAIEALVDNSWILQDISLGGINLRPDEHLKFRVWQNSYLPKVKVLQERGRAKTIRYDLVPHKAAVVWDLLKFALFPASVMIVAILVMTIVSLFRSPDSSTPPEGEKLEKLNSD